MKLRYRLIFLFIFLLILIIMGFTITKSFSFITNDFWFASGLLLLILMSLLDQPFFSTDANIFMNGTAGLSLILVEPASRDFWWGVFLGWCIWLIATSFLLMVLISNRPEKNKPLRDLVSRVNREIGKPETLFSAFFIWGAIRQFGSSSFKIEPLFGFWVVFIIFNIPSITRAIDKYLDSLFIKQRTISDIGSLYRVADPRVVEIKLNKDCPNKIIGQVVGLKTSEGSRIAEAIVIDDRVIAGSRIAKIATTAVTSQWNYVAQQPDKMIFSIQDIRGADTYSDIPISVVDVGSTIESLKFFIHPDSPLSKGDIVWTSTTGNIKVYYQITFANIVEHNVVDGNVARSVLVTANQLGIWHEDNLQFEQFSWIPPAGFLIYRVQQESNKQFVIPQNKVLVGNIPHSNFPILADISDLVTHNTAIIGVTGSGKSYLAFHLIEKILAQNIKVLVLDLTREYLLYLKKFAPTSLRTPADVATWYSDKSLLGIHQFALDKNFTEMTRNFVTAAYSQVSQVDLRAGITVPPKLCIVFEEAHSLIPEWNQVAIESDKSMVNATARNILQGRKYGMGSLLITQRTANVTKTILNQCNTMIAMRSFDQTGLDFLRNYMGNEYSQAISTLPLHDGIIVGKSSSCQSPVIFSIPDFSKRWNDPDEITAAADHLESKV